MSEDELRSQLRKAGVLSLAGVQAVVMETTGEMSVMYGGPAPDDWLMEDVHRGEVAVGEDDAPEERADEDTDG